MVQNQLAIHVWILLDYISGVILWEPILAYTNVPLVLWHEFSWNLHWFQFDTFTYTRVYYSNYMMVAMVTEETTSLFTNLIQTNCTLYIFSCLWCIDLQH